MPSQPLDDALLYPTKQDNHLTPLPGINFYQDELKLVTDDVFSYMCSLAMEKCSKKSEKKKASCGGAAMRKRLLIKNFVAQMLAQERENNSGSATLLNEDGSDMDYSDGDQMESAMDVDDEEEGDEQEEEEDEMEEQDSAQNNPHTCHSQENEEDDENLNPVESSTTSNPDFSICSTSHSMASSLCYSHTPPTFYDSTSVSNITSRSGMVQWTDDFHTVPPTSREPYLMLDEENHCQQHQEGLLYSHYQQYSSTSPPPSNCSPYSSGMNVGALPENLLEDISLWEEKKHMPVNHSLSVDCSSELNNDSSALASLVNMVPSMIKIGCCRSEMLSQEASYTVTITDLDTNTPICLDHVEQTWLNTDMAVRGGSPRKRPISVYQEGMDSGSAGTLCNLMMLSSPKRVKL